MNAMECCNEHVLETLSVSAPGATRTLDTPVSSRSTVYAVDFQQLSLEAFWLKVQVGERCLQTTIFHKEAMVA